MNVATLTAKVSVDPRELDTGLKRAEAAVARFSAGVGKAGQVVAKALGVDTERAVNSAAKVFTSLSRTSETASKVIAAGMRAMERGAAAVRTGFAHVEQVAKRAFTHIQAGARAAGAAMQRFGSTASSSLSGLMGGVGIGGLLGVTAAVAGLGAAMASLGKRGVDMNITVEGATAAMTRISGSASGAARFIGALQQEAAVSALTFKEMLGISQSLAAVYVEKFGPAGLGRVIPTMRAFQDAAAILRVDPAGLQLALGGFRQLAAAPLPNLEDLKQVDEALPGAGVRSIVRQAFGTDESETLAKAGKVGADVAAAIVAGLQRKFAGAQAAAANTLPVLFSNVDDALNALGAKVTSGLKQALEGTVRTVLGVLEKLANSSLGRTLEVVFTGIGRAAEFAVSKLPAFVQWLEKIVTPAGVAEFLSNTIGLVMALGQEVSKAFGVDLKAALDPKNVRGWFDAMSEGVVNVINGAFGLGRVWNEVLVIVKSFFADTWDMAKDWGQDVGRMFKGVFLGIEASINGAVVAMLQGFKGVLDTWNGVAAAINSNKGLREKIFGKGGQAPVVDTTGLSNSLTNTEQKVRNLGQEQLLLAAQKQEAEALRKAREAAKKAADPHRGESVGKRISDAFTGTGRDTSAQDAFWKRQQDQATAAARLLFAGAGAQAAAQSDFPAAPNMTRYGQAAAGAAVRSVNTNAAGYRVPAVPTYTMPAAAYQMPGGQFDARDPYRGVTLENGERTTAFIAGQRGVPFNEGGGYQFPGAETPNFAAGGGSPYGAPGVTVHNNQIVINTTGGQALTLDDFERFYRMYQEARSRESRQSGILAPSRGFSR